MTYQVSDTGLRTPKVEPSKWDQLKEFPIPSFGQ
jgi:hypothetical protein